jgi:hypothetical protein
MSSHNQQMADLLDKMSSALTEKLMEVLPDLSAGDKARLEDQLATYEEDCSDYRELLATDQATTSLTDVVAMQRLLQRVGQADAADVIDLVEEVLEFIEDKFSSAGFATRSAGIAAGGAHLMIDDDDLLGLDDEWEDDDDESDFDMTGGDDYFDDDDY